MRAGSAAKAMKNPGSIEHFSRHVRLSDGFLDTVHALSSAESGRGETPWAILQEILRDASSLLVRILSVHRYVGSRTIERSKGIDANARNSAG